VLFERFPSIIAVATFAALSIIVAHEWAYFEVLGADFQSLFSTYDYIAQLTVWFGPVFVILLFALGVQLASLRADDFERKKAAKSKWGKLIEDWFLEILWFILFILALLLSDESKRSSLYILLSLLWFRLAAYIMSHPKLNDFRISAAGLMAVILPATMIVFYGIGRDSAYTDLKDTKTPYELRLKTQPDVERVKVLRLIEKGIISFDPLAKSIRFHRHDDIVWLKKPSPQWDTRSYVCRIWGWVCTKS
jgi:hypothetical protein